MVVFCMILMAIAAVTMGAKCYIKSTFEAVCVQIAGNVLFLIALDVLIRL